MPDIGDIEIPTTRVEVHGFAPGDRVGHVDQPDVYGHVVAVRHGCTGSCRDRCRLVAVKLYGTGEVVGFLVDDLEHID